MKFLNDIKLLTIGALTLGLAPYFPQPHIWGKLKWIWGGATGMQYLDWLDFLFHGIPWILIGRWLILKYVFAKIK